MDYALQHCPVSQQSIYVLLQCVVALPCIRIAAGVIVGNHHLRGETLGWKQGGTQF